MWRCHHVKCLSLLYTYRITPVFFIFLVVFFVSKNLWISIRLLSFFSFLNSPLLFAFTHAHLISTASISICFIFDLFTLSVSLLLDVSHLRSPSPFLVTHLLCPDFPGIFHLYEHSHRLPTSITKNNPITHRTPTHPLHYWWKRWIALNVSFHYLSHCNTYNCKNSDIFTECAQSGTYWKWNWQCSFLFLCAQSPNSPLPHDIELPIFFYFAVCRCHSGFKRMNADGEREHFPVADREYLYFALYFYFLLFLLLCFLFMHSS